MAVRRQGVRVVASLQRPARLRRGDRVAVVAPSGPVDERRLERGCEALRRFGLEVVLGEHALDQRGFLAGTDEDRAADLQKAWLDDSVRAVVCARGGYGAMRVLDHLDWTAMAGAEPKVFLGSSDITALHLAFHHHLGLATLFGPMPAGFALGTGQLDQASITHLTRTLFTPGDVREIVVPHAEVLVPGRASGMLVGGNLALLAACVGAPELRPAEGAIVLLEDVNEAPYRIDRMLTQLLRAGWFAGVAAIVAGTWVDCGEGVSEVLLDRLGPLGVPIVNGFDFGHGRRQLTMPLGVVAELDAEARKLVLGEPALA
ncbi:S66 peptidase family protein [Carbonactinospora thermoautotrophica]|uniref:S66 peptidase family protein n=1 Tax=Carbonactinospora thermoautotrophica TaxID=1469144 RepID=UPI00082FE481|nr:LD-carboxypeptidase [Carbonactinospora thermoautotrophica]